MYAELIVKWYIYLKSCEFIFMHCTVSGQKLPLIFLTFALLVIIIFLSINFVKSIITSIKSLILWFLYRCRRQHYLVAF